MLRNKRIHFYLVLGLFAVYLINGLIAIPKNSVTYDEMDHWSYGKRILMRKTDKVFQYDDASAMPISGLNAIPRAVQQLKDPGLLKTDGGFSDIMNGRYVTLIVCLLTGFFIYRWSKELFGEKAGVFSLFLFVFCPNLNAYATLLTTDAYAALFTLVTTYYFWKFLKHSGWEYFLLFSVSLGLSQLVKQSLTHLVIIFFLSSLFVLIKRKTIFSHWQQNLFRFFVLLAIVLAIINAGFLFKNSGMPLGKYRFVSKSFLQLQSSFFFINNIPLPLPSPYVQGLDYSKQMDEIGPGDPRTSGQVYILGERKKGEGFWYYYFVSLLYKTPVPVLISFFLALILALKRILKNFAVNDFLLLFPVLYFLVYFSFFYNTQVGIRHIIMFFPLVYVFNGRLMNLQYDHLWKKIMLISVLLYSITTFYFYFPNLISYTNEFITDKKIAYKKLADSNIDYGQGQFWLEDYLKKHPEVKIATIQPQAGRFILGVNEFLDLYGRHNYDWLNKNFQPSAHLKHCFLIFDISSDELKQKGLIH